MYLKKLALSGFKTFADDTILELGPGLTAIVGPNGSGKSNIVDAILWTLGERSHKTLRAHAAADVIFSGSADRKQSGMAEVSMFFDNQDRTLGLDFSEVQVTRRLFRDGDGEYAINKTNCRLRDVVDLFLDTGLGPDAYSIISQSEIDAILSAKPEDRRNLLESAAGVQKYRARRNETRRKLDRVDADLLRVFDITSELEGQLAPLAEQAEIARAYDSLVARLRFLQLAILAREYDLRLNRIEKGREGRQSTLVAVENGARLIAHLEADETELERRLRALETAMDVLQSETTDVVSRLKSGEGQLAVARERRRALTEQQEFLAQEIGLLRARIATAQENAQAARAELQAAISSSASLSEGAAQAETQLGAANVRLQEATRELQGLQSRVIDLMRQSQSRREAAATGRAEVQSLQNRLIELEKLAQILSGEAEQVATARTHATRELEGTKARAQSTLGAIEAARTGLQSAQNGQAEINRALQAAREKRSSLQSRLGALRELEENLEGVQGGARSVLGAVKRGQLSDDYALVADAIRAPQLIETAIEIALGGAVHNLICDRNEQAKRAIGWLKENRAGRATFLPLDALRPSGAGERTRAILPERGVLGIASELVECAENDRRAVEYLLGRVVVVEDIDVATNLARRCDMGARLVTLDGELILPAGAITGGQGKQKTSGLLARKRELDELELQVGALVESIARHDDELKAAANAIEASQSTLRSVQEQGNELRAQIARQEREVEHLEREARRVQTHREAADAQLKSAQQNINGKIGAQGDHEQTAHTLDEQAKTLDEEVARAQKIVAQRQNEREEIAGGVSQVRADFAGAQERLNAMRRSIAELERQIADYEMQVRARHVSIERASGEDAQIVAGEADSVARLAQLQKRRDELSEQAQDGRTERGEVIARLETSATRLKEQRALWSSAQDELHHIEVRLASTEAEIADIERRFVEEHHVEPEIGLAHRDDIEHKQQALDEINDLSERIANMGTVNLGAIGQHEQVRERLEFLTAQRDDLELSKRQLAEIIAEIDGRTRERFLSTFETVRAHFDELFRRVFDGGSTHLSLTDAENLLETGVELRVQPPGKGAQDISLLSGGERALTALTFMLALLKTNPSPFVVLDEIDAPLDQSNVGRFTQLLREFTDQTQFLVITHNNGTMQAADVLYGVTMQKPGVSTLMSVRLVDDLDEAQAHAERNGMPATV